jgi:hypothetical protein
MLPFTTAELAPRRNCTHSFLSPAETSNAAKLLTKATVVATIPNHFLIDDFRVED